MSVVIPRWEWRCFGEHFGAAEAYIDSLTPDRVHESDEVYLLSASGTDAVKVRDGLMDVKHLVQVDAEGLEQWVPVLKAAFPLTAGDLQEVLAALGVSSSLATARTAMTLAELMDDVVAPSSDLVAVDVHKRRVRYTIGGCLSEVTEVRAGGATTRTIAIESEDAGRVVAAVEALGLPLRPNRSFASGLRRLVGFGVERYAVVDVGTNSVKFHIGERGADGRWRTVVDRAETTRLGDGLQETGQLNAEPMARTVEAVVGMVEQARAEGAGHVAAVGTAGLRIAPNSADFVAAVRDRCGVTVEVISGEEESRLAYLGAQSGIGAADGSRVVFDTGGGSSQFTFGHGDQVDERFSVNVGAVRFTERYGLAGAVTAEVLTEALDAIAADLSRLDGRPSPEALVAMGGAVTNLAAVKHELTRYDPEVVQGTVLDRDEIDRQIELYRSRDAAGRREIVGLQPQRADIILAGTCIVRTVLAKLGVESLTVSDRGLRHGVLLERFA